MMFRNRLNAVALAACALALSSLGQNAIAASGAYGSSAVAPTIYSKNIWYNVTFPISGSVPSTATVTNVYYTWNYSSPRPTGFLVYLCNNGGTICFDVTCPPPAVPVLS
jgi:hypothetical protein